MGLWHVDRCDATWRRPSPLIHGLVITTSLRIYQQLTPSFQNVLAMNMTSLALSLILSTLALFVIWW